MDNFSYHIGIIKKCNGKFLLYEMQENGAGEWPRTTKEYLAFVKPYSRVNVGWLSKTAALAINSLELRK